MTRVYYRVAAKVAGSKTLNIPESDRYFILNDYKTENEAVRGAQSALNTGKFSSMKVYRIEEECVQTFNKGGAE